MMIILLIIVGILPFCVLSSKENNASVIWNYKMDPKTMEFFIKNSIVDNAVAWGSFKNNINVTGWSYLEIHTNNAYPDSIQAYAAGLVEGYLTSDLIRLHWNNLYANYCSGDEEGCKRLKNFLQINMNFMIKGIKLYRQNSYWNQVGLILEQLQGLEDAYKKNISIPLIRPDLMGIILLNLFDELNDIASIVHKSKNQTSLGTDCSALIKLLPNFEDLYVGHTTWSSYQIMLRINKKYVFPFRTSALPGSTKIPGHTMSFSSYPGTIFSVDDFYIISSGLVALETTIINNNENLRKYIQPDKIIFEWIRNIVANRLATTGIEWAYYFKFFNSGTYNNQWMIVDYKKFFPGNATREGIVLAGLLTVLEQLPGFVKFEDQTQLLRKESYWASYNSPFYPEIFNLSHTYPDFQSTVRNLIFKRDQGKIHNLTNMAKIMRYNNYKHDNLSRCNCTPEYSGNYAIAARGDLDIDNRTSLDLALSFAYGATDMKITSYDLRKEYKFIAQAGPTYDQQPPFQWSKTIFDSIPHKGQPDLWKFEPEIHQWLNVNV